MEIGGPSKFLVPVLGSPACRPMDRSLDRLGLPLSRFVLCVLRHEYILGVQTLDPVWRTIAWSLNVIWWHHAGLPVKLNKGIVTNMPWGVRL